MKNVFIFWIGNHSKIEGLKSELEEKKFNIIIGPSTEEHKYLYNNYPYYRKSFDEKIWSFCSDIWRIYVLSKYKGVYIDTSVKIGKNFEKFYNDNITYKASFFKQGCDSIASSVMFSGEENNQIFQEILNIFEEEIDYTPRAYNIIPYLLTVKLFEKGLKRRSFDEEIINENIKINSLLRIRNNDELMKIGSHSWRKKNEGKIVEPNKDLWMRREMLWRRGKRDRFDERCNDNILKYGWFVLSAWGIREIYDFPNNKEERRMAVDLHRKISYRKKIDELLLWSRLYVFFKKIFKKR